MNNAEKLIVETLIPLLSSAGFKWVKSRSMFVRQDGYGFSSFSWASHSTNDDGGRLTLDPVLGVRHDSVENIVNQLGLIYGDDNKRYTTTVTRSLGFFPLVNGKQYLQHVRLSSIEDDIKNASNQIVDILLNEGSEFYKKYANLLECSHDLNTPIESKNHALCNNFPRRAYYGVAASYLVEPEKMSSLINQYLDYTKIVLPNQFDQVSQRLNKILEITKS